MTITALVQFVNQTERKPLHNQFRFTKTLYQTIASDVWGFSENSWNFPQCRPKGQLGRYKKSTIWMTSFINLKAKESLIKFSTPKSDLAYSMTFNTNCFRCGHFFISNYNNSALLVHSLRFRRTVDIFHNAVLFFIDTRGGILTI